MGRFDPQLVFPWYAHEQAAWLVAELEGEGTLEHAQKEQELQAAPAVAETAGIPTS